jgi:hypothetical protein
MLQFILKYKNYLIGIALGALAGFLYWRFIGCSSGTCPITSKWLNSTLYGAVVGALLAGSAKKEKKKEPASQE